MQRYVQLTLLPALLLGMTCATRAETSQPNIVLILMEDMGVQIPAYGDHTIATPNLDKLAADGVVFERVHVVAATCASSRGAVFTGLYPHQNGIMGFVHEHGFHFRDNIPTFPQSLRQAGYQCGLTYKTGIEPNTAARFDFAPRYTENWLRGERGDKAPIVDKSSGVYPPLVNNAVENFQYFLNQLEEGTPFYFQAQTPDTHHQWNRPGFIRDGSPGWPYPPVDPDRIKQIPGFPPDLPLSEPLRKQIAQYYTAIQRVDWYVGQILGLLKRHHHDQNTVVIFTADHGPSHMLRGKTTPYEQGLRVPLIARWPGHIQPGTRSNALVSFVDFCPTFLDLAGVPMPDYLPGYSLVPVFEGKQSSRRYLYSAYVAHTTGPALYWPNRTITDGRYKLINNLNGNGHKKRQKQGYSNTLAILADTLHALPTDHPARQVADRSNAPPEFELYDLKDDPNELVNLFGSADHAQVEQRLRTQLAHWRQDIVADPFVDPAYLQRFNKTYAEQCAVFRQRKGKKNGEMKPFRLDWSEWIRPWDPAPYRGKKD